MGLSSGSYLSTAKPLEHTQKVLEAVSDLLYSEMSPKEAPAKHAAANIIRRVGAGTGTSEAPTMPTSAQDSALEDDVRAWAVYKAELQLWATARAQAKEAGKGAYGMLWRLMDDGFKEKVRTQDGFGAAEVARDLEWMVAAIYAVSTGFEGRKDKLLTFVASALQWFKSDQGTSSLDRHYESFTVQSKNLLANGGAVAFEEPFLEAIAKANGVAVADLSDDHFTLDKCKAAFKTVHGKVGSRVLLESLAPVYAGLKKFYKNQLVTAATEADAVQIPDSATDIYQKAALYDIDERRAATGPSPGGLVYTTTAEGSRKRNQWADNGQPICNICGETGHIAKNCPQNPKNKKKSEEATNTTVAAATAAPASVAAAPAAAGEGSVAGQSDLTSKSNGNAIRTGMLCIRWSAWARFVIRFSCRSV